jgi:hypothetical protein
MRVDKPEHDPHDHGFGKGVAPPELHEVGLGDQQQVSHEAGVGHGALDSLGHDHAAAVGGHTEVGHLDHDFSGDHNLTGLDGLHDSVHQSIGLGFAGDQHHSLHEGLHDTHHDPHHADPQHDTHHDGLGDLFHH